METRPYLGSPSCWDLHLRWERAQEVLTYDTVFLRPPRTRWVGLKEDPFTVKGLRERRFQDLD